MEYAWKKGFPWASKADPEQVAIRIKELASGGKYPKPSDVLDDGRNPTSPQHNIFEWDDSVAAENYRLKQAGDILRAIVIVRNDTKEPKKPIRAFVHVEPPGEKEMAYVDITVAMKDESMRRQVLESALKELEVWKETYQGYVEFMPVITAIGLVRDSLQRSGSLVGEKA
jgi:hypothetical protein